MDETEVCIASLEDLCLDLVGKLVSSVDLMNEIKGLPHTLLKCLLPRCDNYRLALLHNTAINRGLGIQTIWRDRCNARFRWFYRHRFKSNLHDPFWQCLVCLSATVHDRCVQDDDWYQVYMDKVCEENIEKIGTGTTSQESEFILRYPLQRATPGIDYKPNQLFLSLKTVIALIRSLSALNFLSHHLRTLMCRIQIPTKYKEPVTSALERFLRVLLGGGKLGTVYLKEQQVIRGESVDYARLLVMLLLGRMGDGGETEREQTEEGYSDRDERSPESHPSEAGDFSEDLYDFCFQEPVKPDFQRTLDASSDSDGDLAPFQPAGTVYDMYCEEGAVGDARGDAVGEDNIASFVIPDIQLRDPCCHHVDLDYNYFQHFLRVPDSRPTLGYSVSNLVLVYVGLNPKSCSTLAECLVRSTSLQSLALIQCVLPSCGWCEIMSGLAIRAQKGLVLQELALTFSPTYRTIPLTLFGQYCAHKLNEMLEAYLGLNHKMTSLKLELLLTRTCQAAGNSFLPKYLPSISCLTLNCWCRPLTLDHSITHPIHQIVSPADLCRAIQVKDSILTDLLLENSSLETEELDSLFAAAAHAVSLKRLSVRRNRYSTSHPTGLIALLHQKGLRSLDLCQCKFSIKDCDIDSQDALVDALINNCNLQQLNLSDRVLGDEDLAILSRAFADTKRTKQHPGYCLSICLSAFSSRALEDFREMLSKGASSCHSNRRLHSLDHLSLDWKCFDMIRTLKTIIPQVTCPHRLSS
ncbi:uncharacterized protein LOC121423930 [Lytechinus variegatus]|uniref:uncharacterized protein LOC121423930 n=1 Tax=Lytechinus variegatus TaxID=7654 RepID=UPI001BB1C868|nr:uncharacterized protein LOC121423930 [Lytechinus variegatus]